VCCKTVCVYNSTIYYRRGLAAEASAIDLLNINVTNAFEETNMVLIREVVQQALATGYLTVAAQEQLRQLLQTTKYAQEDINAFMRLQTAVMDGQVKQEVCELMPA
jgi:hypothetical protein